MAAAYLTTDIIVIIVLVVVLVLIGICAFFIHFYWTKIGVAEIWNTAKWSSMRSSFYRTIRRFSRANNSKFVSEQPLTDISIYPNDLDNDSFERKKPSPMSTSYITSPNTILQEPVSIISSNNSVRNKYATKIGQPMENTNIYDIYEYNNHNNNRDDDGPSIIQQQRF